jgi:hypothetical protein
MLFGVFSGMMTSGICEGIMRRTSTAFFCVLVMALLPAAAPACDDIYNPQADSAINASLNFSVYRKDGIISMTLKGVPGKAGLVRFERAGSGEGPWQEAVSVPPSHLKDGPVDTPPDATKALCYRAAALDAHDKELKSYECVCLPAQIGTMAPPEEK